MVMRFWASAACILLTFAILPALPAAEHASIGGKVIDADGSAVKNATVMVYKAGVKTGYSTYCPTCYVDCGKHTATDVEGNFQLNGLSPDLLFTILVIHDGHSAAAVDRVDPAAGPAGPVTLKPRIPVEDSARVVRGRVVDLQGNALRNAVVEQQGVYFAGGGQSYGPNGWIDLISVTNEKGEFEMAYSKPRSEERRVGKECRS